MNEINAICDDILHKQLPKTENFWDLLATASEIMQTRQRFAPIRQGIIY